jgi:DNA-binding transcriptional ArsR family regulator
MLTNTNSIAHDTAIESQVFRALADPSRRRILDQLLVGDASVNELAAGFDTSRPAISSHLRVLRKATLVVERREGRRRIYSLNPQPMSRADAWLGKYRAFWAARLHALKLFVESEEGNSDKEQES